MMTCFALGCKNSNRRKIDGVSFHSFPKSSELQKKWLVLIGRQLDTFTESKLLCSDHFNEDDFVKGFKKRKLKDYVIPHLNLHDPIMLAKLQVVNKSLKNGLNENKNRSPIKKSNFSYESVIRRIEELERQNNELLSADENVVKKRTRKNTSSSKLSDSQQLNESQTRLKVSVSDKILSELNLIKNVEEQSISLTAAPSFHSNSSNRSSNFDVYTKNMHNYSKYEENESSINFVKGIAHVNYKSDTHNEDEKFSNENNIIIISDESTSGYTPTIKILDDDEILREQDRLDHLAELEKLKCRMCLSVIENQNYYSVLDICSLTNAVRTIKDMIIFCIPQMGETIFDDDLVCSECLESIKFCENYIRKCLDTEAKLWKAYHVSDLKSAESYNCSNNKELNLFEQVNVDDMIDRQPQIAESVYEEEGRFSEVSNSAADLLEDNEQLIKASFLILNCPKCEKVFNSQKSLNTHMTKIHAEVKEYNDSIDDSSKTQYKCNVCKKSFKTKHLYKLHLQKSRCEMSSHSGKYSCKVCGLKFAHYDDLLQHSLIHGFNCGVCSKRFTSKTKLEIHRRKHPNKYVCTICKKCYTNRNSLNSHYYGHDKLNNYLCEECGCVYKSNMSLKWHKNMYHNNNKKFACDKCSKKFLHQSMLIRHQKLIHEYKRDYKCDVCSKIFGRKTSLQCHFVSLHLKLRDFQCEHCGSRFTRIDNLNRHKQTHHNDNTRKGKRRPFTREKKSGNIFVCVDES